jgi:uncharacterized protein YbjT (DUF2867 family)
MDAHRGRSSLTPSTKESTMKIVIIGGSGLIGSKLATLLRDAGHEVVAASPSTGVNTLTGEGLKEALAGAQVVRRRGELAFVRRRRSTPVLRYGGAQPAGRRAAQAGVAHLVALSVVGTDRLLERLLPGQAARRKS